MDVYDYITQPQRDGAKLNYALWDDPLPVKKKHHQRDVHMDRNGKHGVPVDRLQRALGELVRPSPEPQASGRSDPAQQG